MRVPVVVRLAANCYTPITVLNLLYRHLAQAPQTSQTLVFAYNAYNLTRHWVAVAARWSIWRQLPDGNAPVRLSSRREHKLIRCRAHGMHVIRVEFESVQQLIRAGIAYKYDTLCCTNPHLTNIWKQTVTNWYVHNNVKCSVFSELWMQRPSDYDVGELWSHHATNSGNRHATG